MPPITKVQVLLNGLPLVGATVLVGELGGYEKTTDDEGKVALPDVASGYAGYTEVYIEDPTHFATAKVVVKYAETTTIDLIYPEEI